MSGAGRRLFVIDFPHDKNAPEGKSLTMAADHTPETAAQGVEQVLRLLAGRWKLILLFHLFDGKVQRYSDLERLVPGISQKMLAQQLRKLEADGLVSRTVHPQVPPKVEYRLTERGQALCPALDALLTWRDGAHDRAAGGRPRVRPAGASPDSGPSRG